MFETKPKLPAHHQSELYKSKGHQYWVASAPLKICMTAPNHILLSDAVYKYPLLPKEAEVYLNLIANAGTVKLLAL